MIARITLLIVNHFATAIGMFVPLSCFVMLSKLQACDFPCPAGYTAIYLTTLGLGVGSFAIGGFWANFFDIGPDYASVLLTIANSIGTIPAIVGNLVTGWILQDHRSDWAAVFGLSAINYAVDGTLFLLFATGEKQF